MTKKEHRAELELELVQIEKDLDWWDYKLSSEHCYTAPEQKYDLLKKKWAIVTGLKNIDKF